MIAWFKDKEINIFFSVEPDIGVKYPHQSNEKCDKPFLLKNEVDVILNDLIKDKTYEFTIPKGYCWDGATIPKFFYRLIGAKEDPRFLIPSLIHDVLCENHDYVDYDRYFSTRVFERLLYVSGVGNFKRWMMFHSVDNFQKFQNWSLKDEL